MDKRTTLQVNETFAEILQDCQVNKSKVSILFDNSGLERAEGLIQQLELKDENPFIQMQDGMKILLHTIKGVNGYFDPLYAEC